MNILGAVLMQEIKPVSPHPVNLCSNFQHNFLVPALNLVILGGVKELLPEVHMKPSNGETVFG